MAQPARRNRPSSRASQDAAPEKRCDGSRGSKNLALPVIARSTTGKIRKSRNAPRRTIALAAVHLIIIAHGVHYLMNGRTLSPLEPSESMYALELGHLNAGAILFLVAILSTLIFGRFFCGWGCHLVAYQDLCGWIMKKLGVKPQPFRSRTLIWVPLAVAIYMFVWPTLRRTLFPTPQNAFPGFTNHLMTSDFWKTFPGPVFAVLTFLVCGFSAVYFLGAKGFCTYGCPYGGFFGLAERASIGRILVNDDCEQCGHCTATCTSNVRINEEIKRYGMVVDPGCMKCLDCVTVCPNNALSFGFARPSTLQPARHDEPVKKRYDFSKTEDLVLAVLFLSATLAFRGLYDGPPLLMSVGLGGITAYVAVKLWRLLRDPTVRVQNLRIKTAGRLSATGWVFACVTGLWLLFTAHSGFVQTQRYLGRYYLDRTEAGDEVFIPTGNQPGQYSMAHYIAAEKSFRHFATADRFGLFPVVEIKLGLVWHFLLQGNDELAESYVRQAIKVAPTRSALHAHLARILFKRQKADEAIESMKTALALKTPTALDHFRFAGMLATAGHHEAAVREFQECIQIEPNSPEAHFNLGGLLRRMGRTIEAVAHLEAAHRITPDDVATDIELALVYLSIGSVDRAKSLLESAVRLAPENPVPRLYLNEIDKTQ